MRTRWPSISATENTFFVLVDNERGLDMWEPSIKEQSALFLYIHRYEIKGERIILFY